MASWSDIGDPGNLTAGYTIDIKFLNTYINALKERFDFLAINVSNLQEIDNTQGYILTKAEVVNILGTLRPIILFIDWIKQDRYDNPETYLAMDDDTTGIWTNAEIEVLIGSYAYNILTDSNLNSYNIVDLLNHDVWNAIYILYRDVFLYVESRELSSSFLSWERWGVADNPLDSDSCGTGNGTGCISALLSAHGSTYEGFTSTLQASGSGNFNMYVRGVTSVTQSRTFDGNESDYSGVAGNVLGSPIWESQYFIRKHTIKNYAGALVALDVSAQAIVRENAKYEGKGTFGTIDPTFTAWAPEYAATFASNGYIGTFLFDSSIVTGTHWELKSFVGPKDPYPNYFANWVYSLEAQDPSIIRITRTSTFHMRTANGEADLYYNLNSPSMNYNTIP